jgi:hypothetical protein
MKSVRRKVLFIRSVWKQHFYLTEREIFDHLWHNVGRHVEAPIEDLIFQRIKTDFKPPIGNLRERLFL